jgi:hypothetical protein
VVAGDRKPTALFMISAVHLRQRRLRAAVGESGVLAFKMRKPGA